MAIDSRRKRASVAALGLAFLGPSVVPDGKLGQQDRQSVANSYYGIEAGGSFVTIGDTSQLDAITSTGGITLERVIGGTSQLEGYDASGGITTERVLGGTSQIGAFGASGAIQVGAEAADEYAGWPSRDFYAPYWMGTVPQHEIDAIAKERARHERKRLGLPVADEVPARVERVITSVARKQAKRRPGPELEQVTELRRTIERQNAQWDEGFASELTALRKQFREAEESRKAVKAAKKRADKAERERMRSAAKQEIERRERLAEIERRRKRNHNIATTALLLSAA